MVPEQPSIKALLALTTTLTELEKFSASGVCREMFQIEEKHGDCYFSPHLGHPICLSFKAPTVLCSEESVDLEAKQTGARIADLPFSSRD